STLHYRTSNPEAYRLYLLGRHFWNRLADRDNNRRAVKAFEDALALEPSYAPAWAGLATAALAVHNDRHTAEGEQEGCRAGLDAAERAIALDPDLAESYSARALLRMWCR